MPFVHLVKTNYDRDGAKALQSELDYDEREVLLQNLGYIQTTLELEGLEVRYSSESEDAKLREELCPGESRIVFRTSAWTPAFTCWPWEMSNLSSFGEFFSSFLASELNYALVFDFFSILTVTFLRHYLLRCLFCCFSHGVFLMNFVVCVSKVCPDPCCGKGVVRVQKSWAWSSRWATRSAHSCLKKIYSRIFENWTKFPEGFSIE